MPAAGRVPLSPRPTPEITEAKMRRTTLPSLIFRTVFAVPLAFVSAMTTSGTACVRIMAGMGNTLRVSVNSMSGTMEFQMVKKLYGAFVDLFSGFLELGALAVSLTLLFWVSGLFFGLAVCSVFIVAACLYVLACAIGMNWVLDRVRIYLRDCLLLRVCSFTIPVVSVLRGVKFTTGVTVHFPEHSMIWILHAGNWVIRLCWRNCFEPWYIFRGTARSHIDQAKCKKEGDPAKDTGRVS